MNYAISELQREQQSLSNNLEAQFNLWPVSKIFCSSFNLPQVYVKRTKYCVLRREEVYCNNMDCQTCIDRQNARMANQYRFHYH